METIVRDREIFLGCDIDSKGTWDEPRVRHSEPGSTIDVRISGDDQRVAVDVLNQGTIPAELLPRHTPFNTNHNFGLA